MLYDNPALYDALLPVSEGHSRFYRSLARRYSGGLLELACGTGQLLVPLAHEHAACCGLDLSGAMLAVARARAEAEGVSLGLIEADMRDFELGRQFSLIFIARNSLLHLSSAEDFAALFVAVRRHLAPTGVLAFDIFSPDVRALARPAGERYLQMRVLSEAFGELTVEASNDYDAAAQVNRATWFVSSSATQQEWVIPLHLRSIFPEELPLLLERGGFRLLHRDGDLTGGPFNSASDRQVCICAPL
jgi:SAM-dependent methyltransferase